tara:strand:+ start:421 stop:690 length:270 start_codon:yes stop_codon:yes gene_type:complete
MISNLFIGSIGDPGRRTNMTRLEMIQVKQDLRIISGHLATARNLLEELGQDLDYQVEYDNSALTHLVEDVTRWAWTVSEVEGEIDDESV